MIEYTQPQEHWFLTHTPLAIIISLALAFAFYAIVWFFDRLQDRGEPPKYYVADDLTIVKERPRITDRLVGDKK